MTITLHNIEGMDPPVGYSHATAARGDLIVHVSGQVGADDDGVVADGLTAQTERALRNVARALEAAGATMQDVVKSTFYVVGWDPSQFDALVAGAMAVQADHPSRDAALTLVGVQSLFDPAHLIEIEAVAVVDS